MDSSSQIHQYINRPASLLSSHFPNITNTSLTIESRINFSNYTPQNPQINDQDSNSFTTNSFLQTSSQEDEFSDLLDRFTHNTYSIDSNIPDTNTQQLENPYSSENNNNSHFSSTVNSNDLFSGESPPIENTTRTDLGPSDKNNYSLPNNNYYHTEAPSALQWDDLNKSMTLLGFSSYNRFKRSEQFKCMESCYFFINRLVIYKNQGKFDFENEDANHICRKLFEQIKLLQKLFKVDIANRNYRNKFSQSYILFYEEDSFGYLTEILDRAQEETPDLVVNGEKFIFSQEVIDYGNQLFISFCALISIISDTVNLIYEEVTYDNIAQIKKDIHSALVDFDKKWALYEEKYISELISIEKISRRFIFQGIQLEKEMTKYENKLKIKGRVNFSQDKEYNEIRDKFIKVLNELNKVANINGSGRDDLDISILFHSEKVLRTVTDIKSKGMRKLALNIKNSFHNFRLLFRDYNNNIDIVDPQLANNPELVNALDNFEILWEKGKKYFTDQKCYNNLLTFNQIVELISDKYPNEQISNLIELSDPSIFVTLPAVLILRSIDKEDIDIIKEYIPNIDNQNDENGKLYGVLGSIVNDAYIKIKDRYYGYNLFERFVLFDETEDEEKINKEMLKYLSSENIKEFKKDIKILSLNMQRYKPKEWNEFFQLAMEVD